jgi:alpha-L-fucosidase
MIVLWPLSTTAAYAPTWDSLGTRPFPHWWTEAKVGFKLTWGTPSKPSWADLNSLGKAGDCWSAFLYPYFWNISGTPVHDFHQRVYGDTPYTDFAQTFTADLYDPTDWADLFSRAGGKYAYMTAKTSDGFCMFNCSATRFNSVAGGARRDLTAPFIDAIKAKGLKAGVFVELAEAWNPLCPAQVSSGCQIAWNVPVGSCTPAYVRQLHSIIREAVERYEPDLVYVDDNWEVSVPSPCNRTGPPSEWVCNSSTWFNATEILSWIANRPNADGVVINDRWGWEARKHDFLYHLCEDVTGKAVGKFGCNAGLTDPTRSGYSGKWALTLGLGTGFGYNRAEEPEDYKTTEYVISLLVRAASMGGNLELDVPPNADGQIDNLIRERLLRLGDWLRDNGEAIYATRRWRVDSEKTQEGLFYTMSAAAPPASQAGAIYLLFESYPAAGKELLLREPRRGGGQRGRGAGVVAAEDVGTPAVLGLATVVVPPLRVYLLGGGSGGTPLEARWNGEGQGTTLRVTLPPRECGATGSAKSQGRSPVESWFALRIEGAE